MSKGTRGGHAEGSAAQRTRLSGAIEGLGRSAGAILVPLGRKPWADDLNVE